MPTSNKKNGNQPPSYKYVDSPTFQSFYTNNIGYAVSAVDFILIFGEVLDKENDQVVIERRARITMTPAEAKILRGILDSQIKVFEEKVGKPIELPPGMTDVIAGPKPHES